MMQRFNTLKVGPIGIIGLLLVWHANWHLASNIDPEWGWPFLVFGSALFFWAFLRQTTQIEELSDYAAKLEHRLTAIEKAQQQTGKL